MIDLWMNKCPIFRIFHTFHETAVGVLVKVRLLTPTQAILEGVLFMYARFFGLAGCTIHTKHPVYYTKTQKRFQNHIDRLFIGQVKGFYIF